MWHMTGLYKKGQFKPHVSINQQLDKGEATNALARAIFFGKNGEFRERARALNIIINAINIWNTVYMEKAVEELKKKVNSKKI